MPGIYELSEYEDSPLKALEALRAEYGEETYTRVVSWLVLGLTADYYAHGAPYGASLAGLTNYAFATALARVIAQGDGAEAAQAIRADLAGCDVPAEVREHFEQLAEAAEGLGELVDLVELVRGAATGGEACLADAPVVA